MERTLRPFANIAACAAIALLTTVLVIVLQNDAVAVYFPHLERPATDFSAAYLDRELDALRAPPPRDVFLGDSVLWGYRLPPDQTAPEILSKAGYPCWNFSFKSANPANDYLLAKLLVERGIRPRVVIVELNQAVLNWGDPEYATLHPALAALAGDLLSPADRRELKLPDPPGPAQRWLSSLSLLYAMRADIRETLYGEAPPPPRERLDATRFAGVYNLAALDERNVGVHFLAETAALLRANGIPLVAFFTPVNHRLLHVYIDNGLYRRNAAYLRALMERRGARVADFDALVPSDEFFDNAHLTAAGQAHLAAALTTLLSR